MATVLFIVVCALPINACSNASHQAALTGNDDAIETLARGGVAVMDDVNSATPVAALTAPVSAMRFTRWQVRNLVAEGNAHGGYLGSELDALGGTPPAGTPPLSTLIAAWLVRDEGPLAEYASSFMGSPDYKHAALIVFPTIVLLTFIGDIARSAPSPSAAPTTGFDLEPLIASPAMADGECTAVSNWVSGVVASVTTAMQANGSGWLASLWNSVVAIASNVIGAVAGTVLQSLTNFVTRIATIAAMLMQVASMFKPWTVSLAANPTKITLDETAQAGAFDATLNAQDIQWPSILMDCMSALGGVNLNDASYKDAPVTWSQPVGIPALASKTSSDATLAGDKTAHYHFSTITSPKPEDAQCTALVPAGTVGITITVARSDISKVITSLETLIASELPPVVRTYLLPYIQPVINDATSTAATLRAPHATATATLQKYIADPLCLHTPPPGTPSAAPTKPPPGISQTLPFGTCDQIFSNADTMPYLGNAVNLDSRIPADARNMYKALIAAGTTGGEGGKFFSANFGSLCIFGIPSRSDPNQDQPRAIVWVAPPSDLPYTPASADPSDPQDCPTQFGPTLLRRFGADCRGLGNMLTVQSRSAQYGIAVFPPSPPEPPAALMNVLRHVLNRM